jgi:hypothetical protein
MATTGWRLGLASANVTGTWDNLGNVLVEDENTTSFTSTTKNETRTFRVYNFGFDSLVPVGATIDQVNWRNRGARSGGGTLESWLRRDTTDGVISTVGGTSLTTVTVTDEPRPGGGAWTRADILDGNFEIRCRATQPNNTTGRTYEFAWVEIEVLYTEASTGEDLVRVVSEGLGLTHVEARTRGVARLHSEATGIVETLVTEVAEAVASFVAVSWAAVEAASVGGIVRVIDEAMAAGEQTLRAMGLSRPVLEPVGIGHASARVRGLNRIRTDAVAVAEGRLFARTLARVRAEALGLNESTGSIVEAIGQEIVRVLSGAVELTEAAGRALSLTRRRAGTVGLTETTARPRTRTGLLSEPLEVSESITQLRALVQLRSEVAAVSETTAAVLDDIVEAIVRIVSEAVAIPETSAVARALVRMHSETLAIAESVVRLGGVVAAVVPAIVRHRGRMETQPATSLETPPSARMSSRPARRM